MVTRGGECGREDPATGERWKTVASFAESHQQPANSVARAMLQQVTSEAVAMSTLVRPRDVATSAPVKRPLMVLAGASVALVVFLFSNFAQTSIPVAAILVSNGQYLCHPAAVTDRRCHRPARAEPGDRCRHQGAAA